MLKKLFTSTLLSEDSKFTSANGTSDLSLIVESAEGDCCCCPVPTYGEEGVKKRDSDMNFGFLKKCIMEKNSIDNIFSFLLKIHIKHQI